VKISGIEVDAGAFGVARINFTAAMMGVIEDLTHDVPVELTRLFNEVKTRCGVTRKFELCGLYSQMPLDLSSGPLEGPGWPGKYIVANPMVLKFISEPMLAAIMAHEFGHLVNDDSDFRGKYIKDNKIKFFGERGKFEWENLPAEAQAEIKPIFHYHELRADAFAKAHGYGAKLAEWFTLIHPGKQFQRESLFHPSPAVRVERLLAVEEKAAA
jgi:hypothetical protein